MLVTLDNIVFKLIGDPHLGKEFKNGVPLHRRGEREKHQMETFAKEILEGNQQADIIIVMGDLFDKFQVSNNTLLECRDILDCVEKPCYILMGNHDVTRNTELASSFDVMFNMVVADEVRFITEITEVYINGQSKILLCPYDAFTTTEELFKDYSEPLLAAFGHWDTSSFGGSSHNLLPAQLGTVTNNIFTGHEHTPKDYFLDNGTTKVVVTGSMLPYSHAEDPNANIYVTISVEEFNKEPEKYVNKCVRLLVKKGEELPENLDVLQLTVKFIEEDTEEEEIKASMEDFSMKSLFQEVMKECNVSEETANNYWEKYQNAAQS